jgi:integrase
MSGAHGRKTMGKLSNGVQTRKPDGKSILVIDFRFRDKDGREQRYRRNARVQTRAGAEAEARRLMEVAHATGSLELRAEAPTLRAFVDDTFRPLYRSKFRAGTWRRYEGLLRQGLLLRTVLVAAVETGSLDAMPDLPKPPPPGRKLPSAPSTEEVEAMLGKAEGWPRVAIALAAFAGLRQGEVRALEVRDVDLKTGVITIRHALSENEAVAPKSGHERVVPLWPRLAEVLTEALRGKLPAATRPSLGPRAELPRLLRHYFLTALVRGGAKLEAVRELAGHSKLHTTQRYVHATGADLRNAIGRLPGN